MKPFPRIQLESFRSTSAQPHCIPPHHPELAVFTTLVSKLHSRVSASRNRGGKFNIQNRCVAPLTPLFLNPLTPRYCVAAFTLIELMASTTVLSVVLLMMVGMQDQMSKAWSNANRRTDATREARAACLLMARDLSTFSMRGKTFSRLSSFPNDLTNAPVPFYYFNGANSLAPGGASNCAQFFGLIPKASTSNNPADVALVGYYIALGTNTDVNGFKSTNYNLYRYYVAPSNAITQISNWMKESPTTNPAQLFSNSVFIQSNSEILARNACNLQLTFYSQAGTITNGLNYSNNTASGPFYSGNKIAIELSFYPEDVAQKIPSSAWTNAANIQKYARSFEFRIDSPKN